MYATLIMLLLTAAYASGQSGKCIQIPRDATELQPTELKNVPFKLGIPTKDFEGKYLNDQTYVLILESTNTSRPFREFMITVEDPDVDDSNYNFDSRDLDMGTLKTLDDDTKSRYSERCFNSVENTDYTDKYVIEIHWVSPKESVNDQKIRFRAMVAENKDVWYEGNNLTIVLEKDNAPPIDSSPLDPVEVCDLCSEARYEVTFTGIWSRGTHPRNYPTKPDDNGFSYMIGASHDFDFILWKQGLRASSGLKDVAEKADITEMERDIIRNMSVEGGTRTLIRGKQRRHPYMSEPSYSTFRVDRIHHLFSVVIGMRPSPDWFLGTSRFELCSKEGWVDHYKMSLYPYDAGTKDGISYDSRSTITQPVDNVERVAVGSFNKESPFFQMNLIDLEPFATLEVRRLDVYPLIGDECSVKNEDQSVIITDESEGINDDSGESQDEPSLAESRQGVQRCLSAWSEWYPCVPDVGFCGTGTERRVRFEDQASIYVDSNDSDDLKVKPIASCKENEDEPLEETRTCFLRCYGS